MNEAYQLGQELYRASVSVGSDHIWFDTYYVVKPTEKGAWVSIYRPPVGDDYVEVVSTRLADLHPKWVPLNARFCSTTKERAVERLRARTRSYLKHCRRRLAEAERRARVLELPTETPRLRTLQWWAP